MQIIDDIPIWGEPVDPGVLSKIKTCARTADHVALMADNHKGCAVPIGGVVADRDKISPSGVGYGIGCGNKAVRLDIRTAEVKRKIKKIMNDTWANMEFGGGHYKGTHIGPYKD